MCQERPDLILMFSRCLNSLIVRAWGGRDPKPIEIVKNGGHYAAPRDLTINLLMKTPVLPKIALEATLLNDFGRGANRMGSRLLNDS